MRDRVYPLVAYDMSTEEQNFTLFISLLDSTFGNTATKYLWLKLALLKTNKDDDGESESTNQELITLGYISNAVGRLTIPNCDDWVELASVSCLNTKFV